MAIPLVEVLLAAVLLAAVTYRFLRLRDARNQFKAFYSDRKLVKLETKEFPNLFGGGTVGGVTYTGKVVYVGLTYVCLDTDPGGRWSSISFAEIKRIEV
jgi:hypothetical protein